MVRILSANCFFFNSSKSFDLSISASVRMTDSGVFSSCEASDMNCLCLIQASSTGFTAHLAKNMAMTRKTMKLRSPMKKQFRIRFFIVATSEETSAKTIILLLLPSQFSSIISDGSGPPFPPSGITSAFPRGSGSGPAFSFSPSALSVVQGSVSGFIPVCLSGSGPGGSPPDSFVSFIS